VLISLRTLFVSATRCAPLLLALSCATAATPPGYPDAVDEVRRNLKTREGRRYNKHVFQRTRNEFDRIYVRCHVRSPSSIRVHVLYRLDPQGKPLESIVYPPTTLGECVRKGLADLEQFELIPPPKGDYWIVLPAPYSPRLLGIPRHLRPSTHAA